jgi:hypothetical protein
MKIKIKCDFCKKLFETQKCWLKKDNKKHHFCSRLCFGKWSSKNKQGKNNPNFGNHILSIKYKGKKNPFYGKHHTEITKQKIRIKISGKNHYNWQGGKSFEEYSKHFKDKRESIRKRDNYTCQLCNKKRNIVNTKLEKFTVHHIDYDKQNCKDSNLITLCRKCNSKVNINRNKWTNYFKKIIKQILRRI